MGLCLASGSGDNTVKLWRVSDGSELRTLGGHTNYVTSLAFALDGTVLASASWDKTVKLWRVSDGSELHTLSGLTSSVSSIAFSPDGTVLASGSGDGTRSSCGGYRMVASCKH
jgi:WD40 repeat protein